MLFKIDLHEHVICNINCNMLHEYVILIVGVIEE
jgi:hypothetical protein